MTGGFEYRRPTANRVAREREERAVAAAEETATGSRGKVIMRKKKVIVPRAEGAPAPAREARGGFGRSPSPRGAFGADRGEKLPAGATSPAAGAATAATTTGAKDAPPMAASRVLAAAVVGLAASGRRVGRKTGERPSSVLAAAVDLAAAVLAAGLAAGARPKVGTVAPATAASRALAAAALEAGAAVALAAARVAKAPAAGGPRALAKAGDQARLAGLAARAAGRVDPALALATASAVGI